MAYFLKKTNNKKGTYLQIYESYYDQEIKGARHRSYKPIGYVHELEAAGISNPIEHFQREIDQLNLDRKAEKEASKRKRISDAVTPERLMGYFPISSINDGLDVKKYIDLMQSVTGFKFSIYDLISALMYSRIVKPCSKSKTYDTVLPLLHHNYDLSLNQIYDGLEYIGKEYEKIIEIYNKQIREFYPFVTDHTYFDCTNFYFEIDREDSFKRKGMSKQHQVSPLVGMGLLLDANQIPLGMKIYPGNESEKPVLRNIIADLKRKNNINGRTISVADKGLNCAENIKQATDNKDGYIFSKSVKMASKEMKGWILDQTEYNCVYDKDGNLKYKYKSIEGDFEYTIITADGKKETFVVNEKRIVTYNSKLAEKHIYEINRQVEKALKLTYNESKKSEYGHSAKYVNFDKVDKDGNKQKGKFVATLNQKKIQEDKELAGYNMLVTSETGMSSEEIYKAYHNLWRIEESFRLMKSQLEARPVYLQKRETITAHFLICYLSVVLTRIFQIYILNDEFGSEKIFDFFKNFKVVNFAEHQYINLTTNTQFLEALVKKTNLPLDIYFLNDKDINTIFNYKFLKKLS